MATDLLFQIAAGVLLLSGVFMAWRFGWRDPGKGTRRCPKCWYDMTATMGLRCPECGREAALEKQLHRAHRKRRWIAAGLLVAVASYPVFKWPLFQRSGWVGMLPRTATIWLIPDLPKSWVGGWGGKPRGVGFLVDEINKAQPFDRLERHSLARMFARVMRDPERYKREFEVLWVWSRYIGDQSAVVGSAFADAFQHEQSAPALVLMAEQLAPVDDVRMSGVVKPVVAAILAGRARPSQSDVLLDRLKLWGASDEDLRQVAFVLIANEEPGRLPDGRLVKFLWRENLIRPEDADRVTEWAKVQVWEFATYTTFLACEVPGVPQRLLPELAERMKIDGLQELSDWTCLAGALGRNGSEMLPAFERMRRNRRYPSFGACSDVAIKAIEERPLDAYRSWWENMQGAKNGDATGSVQRYKLAPVVLYLDIPMEMKVEGLIEVLRLECDDHGRGAGASSWIAIESLGKLGSQAHSSLGQLCALIEPGADYFFVERLLRVMGKIGPLTVPEMHAVQRSMDDWRSSVASHGNALIEFENLRAKHRK